MKKEALNGNTSETSLKFIETPKTSQENLIPTEHLRKELQEWKQKYFEQVQKNV